jgi:hypothetical protein
MRKFFISIALIALTVVPIGVFGLDTGVDFGASTGLGGADIREVIARIIQVALGLLGIIALVLVLYGGYLWMTAAGDDNKVAQAKMLFRNAVIGLTIILMSFSIVTWVLAGLSAATGSGSGGTNVTDNQPPPIFPGCSPDGSLPTLCSSSPSSGPEGIYVTLRGYNLGGFVLGQSKAYLTALGIEIELAPVTCGGASVWSDNYVVVEIRNAADANQPVPEGNYQFVVQRSDGVRNSTTGRAPISFAVTPQPTTPPPSLACVIPGSAKEGAVLQLEGKNLGIVACATYPNCGLGGVVTFAGATDRLAATESSREATRVSMAVPAGALSSAADGVVASLFIGGQQLNSNALPFTVVCDENAECAATGCCAQGQCMVSSLCVDDRDDSPPGEGESCDATPQTPSCDPTACADGLRCDSLTCTCQQLPGQGEACLGADQPTSCVQGGACAPGLSCSDGCTCQLGPEVISMSPDTGAFATITGATGQRVYAGGDFVTIAGRRFGSAAGTVFFTGQADGQLIPATVPEACDPATSWTDTQIIVQVPLDAVDGRVTVETSAGLRARSTSDFQVVQRDQLRPGLCAINPNAVVPGDAIAAPVGSPSPTTFGIFGVRFGENTSLTPPNGAAVLLGTSQAEFPATATWRVGRIDGVVIPATLSGGQTIRLGVRTAPDVISNALDLKLLSPTSLDIEITDMSPTSGPEGTYVRLGGRGFGTTPGLAFFIDPATPDQRMPASIDFPQACAATRWSDTNVLIRVPAGLTPGKTYGVTVKNTQEQESQPRDFTVTGDALPPQICALTPDNGPAMTQVRAFGDGFGSFSSGAADHYVEFTSVSASARAVVASGDWQNREILFRVPESLVDGNYEVRVHAAIRSSEPSVFQVGSCFSGGTLQCGGERTCCAPGFCAESCVAQSGEYAWRFRTTDARPRITRQYPTGALPIGADPLSVQVDFDQVMNPATFRLAQAGVTDPTLFIQVCDGPFVGNECRDDNWTNLPATSTIGVESLRDGSGNIVGVSLRPFPATPAELLDEPQLLYRVVVSTEVRSANGFALDGLNTRFDTPNTEDNAFSWTFTRDQFIPCTEENGCVEVCEDTVCQPLYAPRNLGATQNQQASSSAIDLVWLNPNTVLDNEIIIERKGITGQFTEMGRVDTSTYSDQTVAANAAYTYRVAAVHTRPDGTSVISPYSNEASAGTACSDTAQCGAGACCAVSAAVGQCLPANDVRCTQVTGACQDTSSALHGIDQGCSVASPCCGSDNQCAIVTFDVSGNVTCSTPNSKISNPGTITALPGQTTCATCLTGIDPAQSTWLETVTLSGKNFGSAVSGSGNPVVVFASNVLQRAFSWVNNNATLDSANYDTASLAVPISSVTGDVVIRRVLPSGQMCQSNPLPLQVRKPELPRVAEISECNPVAGILPSPSPRPASTDACLNGNIAVQFTQQMLPSSLDGALELSVCRGGITCVSGVCTETQDPEQSDCVPVAAGAVTFPHAAFSVLPGTGTMAQYAIAAGTFEQNTWYKAVLSNQATNTRGFPMERGYVWYFRTQAGNQPCAVDQVGVQPAAATIRVPSGEQSLFALPLTASCQVLDDDGLTWSWRSNQEDIVPVSVLDQNSAPRIATAKGLAETGETPADITATAAQGLRNTEGISKISVDFDQVYVVDAWPDNSCADACTNAEVGVQFSTPVPDIQLSEGKVFLVKESDFDPQVGFDPSQNTLIGSLERRGNRLILALRAGIVLDAETQYRVALRGESLATSSTFGGIRSEIGETMYIPGDRLLEATELESGEQFSWYTWTFKTGASTCAPSSIESAPQNATLWLGTQRDFVADVYSQEVCGASGPQRLTADANGFIWGFASNKDACIGSGDWGGTSILRFMPGELTGFSGARVANVQGIQRGDAAVCVEYKQGNAFSGRAGSSVNVNYCDSDLQCERGGQCGGSQCVNNRCTPVVTSADPQDGAPGTWVTIQGCYFGAEQGDVQYQIPNLGTNPEDIQRTKSAIGPSGRWPTVSSVDGNLQCTTNWSDTLIISEVPGGSLSLHFNFEEGLGSTTTDQSLRNHRGILDTDAGWVDDGLRGGALSFAGGGTSRVLVASEDSLVFGDRPFTVQFFARMGRQVASPVTILEKTGDWQIQVVDLGREIVRLSFAQQSGDFIDGVSGAILQNSATLRVPQSRFGGGIKLDGQTLPRLQVAGGTMPGLNVDVNTVAVEFWMKAEAPAPATNKVILSQQASATAPGWELVLQPSGKLSWRILPTGAGAPISLAPTNNGSLYDGQWHHVMYFISRSNEIRDVTPFGQWFVDGVSVGQDYWVDATGNDLPGLTSSAPLRLGHAKDDGTDAFIGELDELRIYDFGFRQPWPPYAMLTERALQPNYFLTQGLVRLSTPSGGTDVTTVAVDGDKWHHIAVVRENQVVARLYVDGVQRAMIGPSRDFGPDQFADGQWPSFVGGGDLVIGGAGSQPNGPQQWVGTMDELYIYKGQARLPAEILRDAQQ